MGMTEPPEESKTPSNIDHLVLKAMKGLPEDEQRAFLMYFVERGMGAQPPWAGLSSAGPELRAALSGGAWHDPPLATMFTAEKPRAPQQTIPVRLSEEQHRRLKQWCAEHNFHMSVVVRGLIDRFLDSWEEGPA